MASIVDYLNSQKLDSSFSARAKLATKYGIAGYQGTAAQNNQLLAALQKPVAAPASPLSGSVSTSGGVLGFTLKPSTAFVGAKTATPTASVNPGSLFSVSRPGATEATTNSPGFQIAKPTNALGGSTSSTSGGVQGFTLNRDTSKPTADTTRMGGGLDLNSWSSNVGRVSTDVTIPTAISTDALKPVQNLELPTYQEKPLPSLSEYLKSGVSGSSSGSSDGDYGYSGYQGEADRLGDDLLSGMGAMANKGARKYELEKQAGLADYNRQLNDINGQLAALNAEATGKTLDTQGKAIANTFINRQTDAIERERTVKALGLSAIAQTLQGNIALANDTVAKALDAEFSPIESKIEYLKTAISLNESRMTRAEKAKAAEQAVQLKQYELEIENQKETRKNVYDLAMKAAENGADSLTINKILGSKSQEEALSYAGKTVAKSNDGLSASAIQSTVNGIVNQFDGEPTVKNYQVTADGYEFAKSLVGKSNPTPSDDQGLLYAFAKAMDPNSVVREGEYATVQKYAQSWADSFGFNAKRIFSNSTFLTTEARANMIQTIKSKYDVSARSYQNVYDNYQRRIEDAKSGRITGSVTDYSMGYGSGAGGVGGQPSNPNDPLSIFTPSNVPSKTVNGSLSQRYESGGNPGVIGYDSTGGYSYGKYQLAHNNAKAFVDQSPYAKYFQGLAFNSPEFRRRWQEVAKADPQGFGKAQEAYVERTHLQPQAQKLTKLGISFDNLSPALREVVFSTAIQHGPNNGIITGAIAKLGPNATEQDLIKQIYADRWNGGRNFASSTASVRNSVYNRFFGQDGELANALKMSQQTYA